MALFTLRKLLQTNTEENVFRALERELRPKAVVFYGVPWLRLVLLANCRLFSWTRSTRGANYFPCGACCLARLRLVDFDCERKGARMLALLTFVALLIDVWGFLKELFWREALQRNPWGLCFPSYTKHETLEKVLELEASSRTCYFGSLLG